MTVPVRATPWCLSPVQFTCRELLAGAGAGAAALSCSAPPPGTAR